MIIEHFPSFFSPAHMSTWKLYSFFSINSSSIIQPHVLPGLSSATENIANTSSNHQTTTITTMSFCRSQDPTLSLDERLRILYPMVNEDETPLPRCWSTKDKFNFIGLSQNNLRVQYKGNGKSHKEASSVRATHPIPASCGIYYFEVKIVSKGKVIAFALLRCRN